MNVSNEELLAELDRRLRAGKLDRTTVQALLAGEAPENRNQAGAAEAAATEIEAGAAEQTFKLPAFSLTRLLYVVGGLLVVLGVGYLMSELWEDMSSGLRIVATLGLGLIMAVIGSVFLVLEPDRELGTVFHGIGGFVVPAGALVTLDEMAINVRTTWPVALTIGMVFVFYLLLTLYHRRVILSFFAFANGTGFIYLLTDSLLPAAGGDVYAYLTMLIGVSYVSYAWAFRFSWNARLVPVLYFFGPLGFYIAAFSRVANTRFMELLYPFLAFGGMALSVAVLRSRIALVLSTLAVIGYIVYLTAEYFADSIGWPVALIILGFLVIGLGYTSLSLHRRFLKPEYPGTA